MSSLHLALLILACFGACTCSATTYQWSPYASCEQHTVSLRHDLRFAIAASQWANPANWLGGSHYPGWTLSVFLLDVAVAWLFNLFFLACACRIHQWWCSSWANCCLSSQLNCSLSSSSRLLINLMHLWSWALVLHCSSPSSMSLMERLCDWILALSTLSMQWLARMEHSSLTVKHYLADSCSFSF